MDTIIDTVLDGNDIVGGCLKHQEIVTITVLLKVEL